VTLSSTLFCFSVPPCWWWGSGPAVFRGRTVWSQVLGGPPDSGIGQASFYAESMNRLLGGPHRQGDKDIAHVLLVFVREPWCARDSEPSACLVRVL